MVWTLQHFEGVKMLKAGHGKHNIFIDLQTHLHLCGLHTSPHKFLSNSKLIPVASMISRRECCPKHNDNNDNKDRLDHGPIRESITHQWHGAQVHSIAGNVKIFIQEAFLVSYFSLFTFVITQITIIWTFDTTAHDKKSQLLLNMP